MVNFDSGKKAFICDVCFHEFSGEEMEEKRGGEIPVCLFCAGKFTPYVINSTDSLRLIAARFHYSIEELLKANPELTREVLAGVLAGMKIRIPVKLSIYKGRVKKIRGGSENV